MAVVLILPDGSQGVESGGAQGGLERLRRLRADLYGCFARRPDALFELCDAMLCAPGPVVSPVELSLEPEFRRRHAMVYNALVWGVVDAVRLRRTLVGMLPQPRPGEPAMFAVDVSPVPRPDPRYVDGLSMVQVRGAGGDRFLPGWPLSVLVGLEWGACSWVDPLDVRRIRPGEDHTRVLIEQVEGLVGDLQVAGRAASGGAVPLVMFDAGYPASRVAHEVCGSGVQVLGRVRSDRVFYFPAPAPGPGPGRRAHHGARFACSEAQTHPVPDVRITAESERYGQVRVAAWHGLHQALTRTGAWADHPPGDLPIVSGTLIRVVVDRLPHDGKPKPMWLWHCAPPGIPIDVDLLWKAYLRRFDQEHFHRFAKTYLGLARARVLSSSADDMWNTIVIACYAQLRAAAGLVADEPRPWQRKTRAGRIPTPCRVRAGFRRLRVELGTPAGAVKKVKPGLGRPPGRPNSPKPLCPVYNKSDIELMAKLARAAPT